MDRASTPEYKLNWIERFACDVIKCGRIPKHVAFIMDGNRRYADKAMLRRLDGHKKGFDTLSNVLGWCRELGITQVTLYAFSIENFKRSEEEVSNIMNLARDKCDSILDEIDRVNEAGIRVKVAGDLHLLPKDLQDRAEKLHRMTSDNNKAFLNVCMAYTGRHEIAAAIDSLARKENQDNPVNIAAFENELYLPKPYPEIIIRTSGEIRLSDFMLWQCQDSQLMFLDVLWPEITIWDVIKTIFYYQIQCIKASGMRRELASSAH